MNEIKKINLSAMMKNANQNEDTVNVISKDIMITNQEDKTKPLANKIEDNKLSPIQISNEEKSLIPSDISNEKQTPSVKTNSKISLSTIKSVKEKKEVIIDIPKKKVIKDKHTLYYESLTSKVVADGQNINTTPPGKVSLKSEKNVSIKKPIGTSKNQGNTNAEVKQEKVITGDSNTIEERKITMNSNNEKREDLDQQQSKVDNNNGDVFTNYESDYKKKESSILSTIKELTKIANLKKLTKTNKVFVSGIIMVTTLGISFLFYVDPEVHSIENYKASILDLAGQAMTQEEIKSHQTDIINDIAWKLNQNNLGGYQLDFDILVNDLGSAVYKFDGNEYRTKVDLDTAIQEKLIGLKLNKIRNYIKNK